MIETEISENNFKEITHRLCPIWEFTYWLIESFIHSFQSWFCTRLFCTIWWLIIWLLSNFSAIIQGCRYSQESSDFHKQWHWTDCLPECKFTRIEKNHLWRVFHPRTPYDNAHYWICYQFLVQGNFTFSFYVILLYLLISSTTTSFLCGKKIVWPV